MAPKSPDDDYEVELTADDFIEGVVAAFEDAPTRIDDPPTLAKCAGSVDRGCGGDCIVSRAPMPDPEALANVGCARSATGAWAWCAARRWFGRRVD